MRLKALIIPSISGSGYHAQTTCGEVGTDILYPPPN
jgi:hypothetical protein